MPRVLRYPGPGRASKGKGKGKKGKGKGKGKAAISQPGSQAARRPGGRPDGQKGRRSDRQPASRVAGRPAGRRLLSQPAGPPPSPQRSELRGEVKCHSGLCTGTSLPCSSGLPSRTTYRNLPPSICLSSLPFDLPPHLSPACFCLSPTVLSSLASLLAS